MSSSWSNKLETKLSKLADNASKESIQTLAKWMGFNRKKHVELSKGLINKLINTEKTTRKWLYLQVANEILLLENGNVDITKWDKLSDLRSSIGDVVIIPSIKEILVKDNSSDDTTTITKLTEMINEWDEKNVFGPTFIKQVRNSLTTTPTTPAAPAVAPTTTETETKGDEQATDGDVSGDVVHESSDKEAEPSKEEEKKSSEQNEKKEEKKIETVSAPSSNDAAAAAAAAAPESVSPVAEAAASPSTAQTKTDTDSQKEVEPAKDSDNKAIDVKGQKEKEEHPVEKETNIHNDDDSKSKKIRPTLDRSQSDKSLPGQEVTFDFEAQGIPYEKIDNRTEFLDSCKTIATLQIARELRNDTAIQISSSMDKVPEDVRHTCQDVFNQQEALGSDEDDEETKISEEKAEQISLKLPEDLVELDIDEAIANVRTFRDIVQKQRTAREELILMLIKSRCQFGSDNAAVEYYKLEELTKLMKQRKESLSDAMDLEGLDFTQTETEVLGNNNGNNNNNNDNKKGSENRDDNFEPLSWYDRTKSNNSSEEPDAKKARVE